jgi:hypothetical protein
MNKDVFEEKWKQIRGQTKGWWALFDEYDLVKVDKAPVKRDKYVVMLQVKYGYTRQRAVEEIDKRVMVYEAGLKRKTVPTPAK